MVTFVNVVSLGLVSACVGCINAAFEAGQADDGEVQFDYATTYPFEAETVWSEEAQGIAHDDSSWYLSDRWSIYRIPLENDLAEGRFGNSASLPPGCGHFGDLDHAHGHLYVALEECEGRSPNRIYQLDAATFGVERWGRIPTAFQAGAPWVAVTPAGFFVTSDFEADTINIFSPDFESGEYLRLEANVELPRVYHRIQGGELSADGLLYLVSDDAEHPTQAGIYVFELRGEKAREVGFIPSPGVGDSGSELEGMTLWDLDSPSMRGRGVAGHVHWIMLDNDGPLFDGDDASMMHARRRLR